MTADESDKDHLEVVVHFDDQAVFVAADVEDNPVVGKKLAMENLALISVDVSAAALARACQALRVFSITMTRLPRTAPRFSWR